MTVQLICSKQLNNIIKELLSNRNITIDDSSKVILIERSVYEEYESSDIEKGESIQILFDMASMEPLLDLLEGSNSTKQNEQVITGKLDDAFSILNKNEIFYFEGIGNDVYAITKDGHYKVKQKLYELDNSHSNNGLIRISKSHVVNILKIATINPWFSGKLLLKMEGIKIDLEVTRNYVKEFKEFLGL